VDRGKVRIIGEDATGHVNNASPGGVMLGHG
jgi:hypothetical protein